MQFTQTSLLAAFAVASFSKVVLADSPEFYLQVIRSGSPYQLSSIVVTNNALTAGGSGNGAEVVITDDGKLKLSDGSYVVVKDDKLVVGTDGSSPFSISSDYLAYAGSQGFSYASSSDGSLSVGGSNPIALKVLAADGSSIDNYTAGSSSSATANATTTTVQPTVVPTSNVTTSSASPSSISEQSENGAAKLGAGIGLGLAGIAALLI